MALSMLRFGARAAVGALERSYAKGLQEYDFLVARRTATAANHGRLMLLPRALAVRSLSSTKHPKYASESDSDSDSDSDEQPVRKKQQHSRAESDFWRRKMRTIHGILDVNKDGVVSYDDFKLLADRFVDLGHLSEQSSRDFHQCIRDLWEKQWGEVTPYNLVTMEQYLEDMHHVLNDKELKKKVHSFLPYLFKAVDKDQSGEISVEEFKLFFQCLGVDEVHAQESFDLIDTNNDGRITIKEFVKHGREFFLSEDQSRPSKLFWGPLSDMH